MHAPRPLNRLLCLFCLLGPYVFMLSGVAIAQGGGGATNDENEHEDLPMVTIARVTESDVSSGVRVVGTVNPLRSSTIGSAVSGRVKEVYVDQGELVSEGQPLAQLRTETLEIERRAALAELKLFEQQLKELENGSRPEEVAEASANALGAEAAMKNAAVQLKRTEQLVASRAATETALEDARERAKLTEYAYNASEAALERIQRGPRIEQIMQAEAQLELQRENVALIEDRIEKHTLLSPFAGFVSADYTEVGAWINSGDPVAQVIQLDQVEIEAPTTADHATRIRPGDEVRVEFPELPDQLLTGTVHRLVPLSSTRARTFPVLIRMENPMRSEDTPMLMAGMLARIVIPAGPRQMLPLVPKDALVLNARERAVYVLEPSSDADSSGPSTGVARKVSVDLGTAVDGRIQVIGDLSDGQFVIVEGNERLTPDIKVRVQSMVEADSMAQATHQ